MRRGSPWTGSALSDIPAPSAHASAGIPRANVAHSRARFNHLTGRVPPPPSCDLLPLRPLAEGQLGNDYRAASLSRRSRYGSRVAALGGARARIYAGATPQ